MDTTNKDIKCDANPEPNIVNEESSIKFVRIRDIVIIVAALFGIIAFLRTCHTENKLEEVSYRLASIDHQPKLKITGVNTSLNIDTLSVRAKEDVLEHEGTNEDPHPFKVELAFSANVKVKIENVGDSAIGKIRLLLTTDQSVNFKKFVTGKIDRKDLEINFKEWPELTNLQILPGDCVTLGIKAVIKKIENKQFVMHIVIVYENDFGNIYHTHTRIPFSFEPGGFKTIREAKISEIQDELREYVKDKLLNKELMSVGPPISTYAIYNETESEQVREYIRSFREDD